MKLRPYLKKLWITFLKIVHFIFVRLPVLLVLLVGLYYVRFMFSDLTRDTTALTNTAFALTATIAALSFSCSRAIEGPPEAKDEFAYVGERFFHSGLMLLIASILKYALLSFSGTDWGLAHEQFTMFVTKAGGSIVPVLFIWALFSAHSGLMVVHELLWSRYARHSRWDDII